MFFAYYERACIAQLIMRVSIAATNIAGTTGSIAAVLQETRAEPISATTQDGAFLTITATGGGTQVEVQPTAGIGLLALAQVTATSSIQNSDGSTTTTLTLNTGDQIVVTSPPLSSTAPTTIRIITLQAQPEPSPPSVFNPFSTSTVTTFPPCVGAECNPIGNPYCGDSVINGLEKCESPNTNNNAYCSQSTSICVGALNAIRDSFGNCDASCACDYDLAVTTSCVKGSCGAVCSSNAL